MWNGSNGTVDSFAEAMAALLSENPDMDGMRHSVSRAVGVEMNKCLGSDQLYDAVITDSNNGPIFLGHFESAFTAALAVRVAQKILYAVIRGEELNDADVPDAIVPSDTPDVDLPLTLVTDPETVAKLRDILNVDGLEFLDS